MIVVRMAELSRQQASGEPLVIPGGWDVTLPEVRLRYPDEEAVYLRYLVAQGYNTDEALARIEDEVQRVFVRGWLPGLKEAVSYAAEKYTQAYHTLEGFKPSEIVRYYFPGDRFGRRGKPGVRKTLARMRDSKLWQE